MTQFLACIVHAVSCTPDSCYLDWMIAAVACVLASHPALIIFGLRDVAFLCPVFLIPGFIWF